MTAEDVRELLRQRVEAEGSANRWAHLNRVSHAYVLDTMARRRAPGPAILHALGVEKDEATYRFKEAAHG